MLSVTGVGVCPCFFEFSLRPVSDELLSQTSALATDGDDMGERAGLATHLAEEPPCCMDDTIGKIAVLPE